MLLLLRDYQNSDFFLPHTVPGMSVFYRIKKNRMAFQVFVLKGSSIDFVSIPKNV